MPWLQPVVRQATVADLELLVPLFDAYRQFYGQPADQDRARRFLLERFQHSQSILFLALDDQGACVGFTQLFPSFSSVSCAAIFILNDLFVTPAARRHGVGLSLLRTAKEFARAIGAVRLTLSTQVTNSTAQALYEAEGWSRQSEFDVYNLTLPDQPG